MLSREDEIIVDVFSKTSFEHAEVVFIGMMSKVSAYICIYALEIHCYISGTYV